MAALFGALPLIISSGMGSSWAATGITIVGGLIVSQALTLYITPVVYLSFNRLREWWETRRGRAVASSQPAIGLVRRGLIQPIRTPSSVALPMN
jgi:multidrug efflux pump